MKRLMTILLLCSPACILSGTENPVRPDVPTDFSLRLAFASGSTDAVRTEVAILETRPNHWDLMIRRSSAGGEWPRLWSETYRDKLTDEAIASLAKEIQDLGFFDLAPQYLDARLQEQEQEPLALEVAQWGRRHLVLVAGRRPAVVVEALQALDALVPVRLGPWPQWIDVLDRTGRFEPGLVSDLEGARKFHRYWLSIEPDRTPLHLDLFAIELALGNPAGARGQLEALREDQTLRGLIPELEAQLR